MSDDKTTKLPGDASDKMLALTAVLGRLITGWPTYIATAALARLLCLICIDVGGRTRDDFLELMGESYDLAQEEYDESAAGQQQNAPGGEA